MSNCTISRFTTFEEFEELGRPWARLEAASRQDNIFLTHLWLSEWWHVYGERRELWTLVAGAPGGVEGILPLVLHRSREGVRKLVFMGAGDLLPNRVDMIAAPDTRREVAHAFWSFLQEHQAEWDLLDLVDVANDSSLLAVLASERPDAGTNVRVELASRASFAALPGSFEEYVQSRTRSWRSTLRYQQRMLLRDFPDAQYGRVETPAELEAIFKALVRLNREHWSRQGKHTMFADADFVRFHHATAHAALTAGGLRLYYLRIGDSIVSVYYCYRVGSRVSYYNAGYDDTEQYERYSLGKLVLAHAIEQSIVEGVSEFDFLQGADGYKTHWTTGIRENCRLRVATPSLRGRLAWAEMRSAESLRAVAHKYVPRGTRRAVKQLLRQG